MHSNSAQGVTPGLLALQDTCFTLCVYELSNPNASGLCMDCLAGSKRGLTGRDASPKHLLADERDEGRAQMRGGGQPLISLDDSTGEERYRLELAERLGFEPRVGYKPTHALQACALNHSAISPTIEYQRITQHSPDPA